MKTSLYVVAVVMCGVTVSSRGADGTLTLGNHVLWDGVPVDAKVYMPDGVTPVCGEHFKAAVFLESETTPAGDITTFYGCDNASAQGYFKSLTVSLPGSVAGSTVSVNCTSNSLPKPWVTEETRGGARSCP